MQTLNDFQKLLGDINWLCPTFGIPTYQLHNLFSLLQGDSSLTSPRSLIKEAEAELQYVEQQLKEAFLEHIDPLQPLTLYF